MKLKIVIFGLFASLTACGVGKGGRNLAQNSARIFPETLELTSLLGPKERFQPQQTFLGFDYIAFASVAKKELPSELLPRDSESEIGTLRLIRELRQFPEHSVLKPTPQTSLKADKNTVPVYILPHPQNSDQVLFAVLKSNGNLFKTIETSVATSWDPRDFCSRAFVPFHQIPGGYVTQQSIPCYQDNTCHIRIHFQIMGKTGYNDQAATLETIVQSHGGHCTETQIHYDRDDTETNVSRPSIAVIEFSEKAKLTSLKKLHIQL